ncbi:MAG: hypothetical protein PHN31_07030, partial [Candidatus Gracilibacteria bacterium]|nr:hypothetical protein [Candidatus Gracilibacteria bacterium]
MENRLESSGEQLNNQKSTLNKFKNFDEQVKFIETSELKDLKGFDNFLDYLKKRVLVSGSKKEIESVISILNSGREKELKEFLDPSNIDGGGYFFDDEGYNKFEKNFSKILKNYSGKEIGNNIYTTIKENAKTSQEVSETSQEVSETNENVTQFDTERKIKYDTVRTTFKNYPGLKNVCDFLDKEVTIKEKMKVLKENQKQIFDVLYKEAKDTGNYNDFKSTVHNFYSLGVINQTRLDELLGMVPKNMNKSLPQNGGNSIVSDYEKKGEELV